MFENMLHVARLASVHPQMSKADEIRNDAVLQGIRIVCNRMVQARMLQENEAQEICREMGLRF